MSSFLAPAAIETARPIMDAGTELFDATLDCLGAGDVESASDMLFDGLSTLRAAYPVDQWRQFSQYDCLHHPLKEIAHADPMTRRAFLKPRGYPGDAGILDLIYRVSPLPSDTTAVGAQVYEVTTSRPASHGVRTRRVALARAVDAAAKRTERPRILSMACGHLREAQMSRAVSSGSIGEYFAVDQDKESLALIDRELGGWGVTTMCESVRGLVTGRVDLDDLDLAYAAGLYDYLGLPVATAVTRSMLGMMKPGGRVLVANFAPSLPDIGYMETFMAWNLIYRDEQGMMEIVAGLPQDQVAATRVYREDDGHIVYLEIVKA
jgi:extracellular factor (EF) 3-hydroxypalmitic acid methyl ester biosynthesis protein